MRYLTLVFNTFTAECEAMPIPWNLALCTSVESVLGRKVTDINIINLPWNPAWTPVRCHGNRAIYVPAPPLGTPVTDLPCSSSLTSRKSRAAINRYRCQLSSLSHSRKLSIRWHHAVWSGRWGVCYTQVFTCIYKGITCIYTYTQVYVFRCVRFARMTYLGVGDVRNFNDVSDVDDVTNLSCVSYVSDVSDVSDINDESDVMSSHDHTQLKVGVDLYPELLCMELVH